MKYLLFISSAILIGIWLKPSMPALYVSMPVETTTEAYTPIPTPTPNSIQVVQAIVKEFEPEGKYVVREALDISFCESGWRFEAINHNSNNTTDHNAFQINSVHTKRYGDKFKTDLAENVRVAHELYKRQGWNPWVCAKKLSYTP